MTRSHQLLKVFTNATRRLAQNDSGSALVELGISSVIVLGTFLAVFQLTMACYTYNSVAQVTRDSARWAAVRGKTCSTNTPNLDHCAASETDIQNYAKSAAALNWSPCSSNQCLTVSWKKATTTTGVQNPSTTWATCSYGSSSCGKPGDMITVSMTYPYAMNLPFFRSYSLTLGSSSTMIVAQ